MELSANAVATLKAAGWSSARRADLNEDLNALRAQGFHFSTAAIEALQRFGGLHLRPPQRGDAAQRPLPFHLDPFEAADGELERLQALSALVGEVLSPLGAFGRDLLAITESGRVVRSSGATFEWLGQNIAAALDRLCR